MKQLRTAEALALQAMVALGFAPAPAAAQLHRCTAADGKVTYTEFPCEAGSKASGVPIHDSSGMEVNKRTNNFSYTPPRSTAPARGSSSRTPAATTRPTRAGSREAVGDVYMERGEFKSKSGGTLERPPSVRMLEPGADKAREQRRLDREWEDYNKQQKELRQKYGDQPLK